MAGVRSLSETENIVHTTRAVSGTLQPKAYFAFQVLVAARKDGCFDKDTFCTGLEDLHELERDSASYQNVSLILAEQTILELRQGSSAQLTTRFPKKTSKML